MYNNQDSGISAPDNQFDSQAGSPSRRDGSNFGIEDRQMAVNVGNNNNNAFAMIPMMPNGIGNASNLSSMNGAAATMSGMNGSAANMNGANAVPGSQQGFMHPSMQANALMMMMNNQPMAGILPLNFMGLMPPGMTLDPDTDKNVKKPKKRRKKPKDRPKRPLSAYNLFFKDEREKILKQIPGEGAIEENERITWPGKKRPPHGKISFEELAKTIGSRWKALEGEELAHYKKKAEGDLERYATQMRAYEEKSKTMEKTPPEKEEEPIKEETKRPREGTKVLNEAKRKKTKKPVKVETGNMNMEMMNNAIQNNMMTMGGNYVFPMILNPGVMSNLSQQNDQLRKLHAQQQQQQLTDQVMQRELMARQSERSPPQNLGPSMINQNHSHSFGLDTSDCLPRQDSTQQLMPFDPVHREHHDRMRNHEASAQNDDRDNNLASYEFNNYNMNLSDQASNNYHGGNYHFSNNNGPGSDDPLF